MRVHKNVDNNLFLFFIDKSEFDTLSLIVCLFLYKWLKNTFQNLLISIPGSVTESTDEMIELFVFKT